MKKHLFFTLLIALILAAITGTDPAQAQGLVEYISPEISSTLGNNGIYISDVVISYVIPADADPQTIIGCEAQTISQDTPPAGLEFPCYGERVGGSTFIGALIVDEQVLPPIIRRDAIPPVLELVSPAQNPVSVNEGSTLTQDDNPVTIGWDLDEDGTIDAPNPTSVPIPGLKGMVAPCFIVIAVDEAGNVSQIEVEVNIINLPPVVNSMALSENEIPFGGAVQLTATTSDPGDDPLMAAVHWSDGLIEPVVVNGDGSIQAEHTYTQEGNFEIKLQLDDGEGGIGEGSKTLTVLSEQDSLNETLEDVAQFVADGTLNRVQGWRLRNNLTKPQRHFDQDRIRPALFRFNRFIIVRNNFIVRGVLPEEAVTPSFYIPDLIVDGWVPEPP